MIIIAAEASMLSANALHTIDIKIKFPFGCKMFLFGVDVY